MAKQLKVDSVVNVAGTGKPNFPVSPTSGGAALSTLNTHSYTSSATEPSSPKNGAIWWDSANSKVYVYANGEFKEITLNTDYPSAYSASNPWSGDRGVFAGGDEQSPSTTDRIQYIDITTPGNSTDFGNLTAAKRYGSGASNSSRGLHIGGYTNTAINNIDYVTISTPGNAADFGDSQQTHYYYGSSCSDGTKAFTFGGYNNITQAVLNNIQQTVIATTGNSTDFGDLSTYSFLNAACGDSTRGVCALGDTRANSTSGDFVYVNNLEYITTASAGNATDFGDTTLVRGQFAACSDATRGLFTGGYGTFSGNRTDTIDYITIQTTGNATDFGDLSQNNIRPGVCANSTRGIIGGGYTTTGSSTRLNTIEYVTIQTPGNATDFGDLAAVNYGLAAFSGSPS